LRTAPSDQAVDAYSDSPAASPIYSSFSATSPRLAVLLDDPEMRVFLNDCFNVGGDVSWRDSKAVAQRADHPPLAAGHGNAGNAVRLPALAAKSGDRLVALHPPGLALIEIASPRLVVGDALFLRHSYAESRAALWASARVQKT
jgi:hypothetical protein